MEDTNYSRIFKNPKSKTHQNNNDTFEADNNFNANNSFYVTNFGTGEENGSRPIENTK